MGNVANSLPHSKSSPSFERGYNLKFLGSIGNILRQEDIELSLADQYSLQEELITSARTPKFISIDASFGSSDLGIIVAEWRDSKLNI